MSWVVDRPQSERLRIWSRGDEHLRSFHKVSGDAPDMRGHALAMCMISAMAMAHTVDRGGRRRMDMMERGDVVGDLEAWLTGADPHTRPAEVELIRRAIDEINALREKLGERRARDAIEADALNASNDE